MTRSPRTIVAVCAGLVLSLAAGGCSRRQSSTIPNRVLDRPLDVVLACVRDEGDALRPVSLEQCSADNSESVCSDVRLLGFVSNSERNDIGLFSRCAGAVIDMDATAPGPQLISAGEVPSSMTITTGAHAGCFAVSANVGSCDLSVLDVTGLASYAFEEPPEDEPSAYVSQIVPRRADGTPLGARPGQVIAVPPELSSAEAGGAGCDPEHPGSVYVTFPGCQLVAEVDLRTQRILQSRQFVRDGGGFKVVDTGPDPVCPIDCADQFLDPNYADALQSAPEGEPDGMYPVAMALIEPPPETGCVDDADTKVEDHALFVAGLGADTLFELRYDGTRWTDDALELEIDGAEGIAAIRPTPAMSLFGTISQFLYLIAGDGSTRVVSRQLDVGRDELGVECDTQIDPTAVTETACQPAEFPGESPPDRRPFARGPGIRVPTGAIITDWTFQKKYLKTDSALCPGVEEGTAEVDGSSPFIGSGVVGIGTTSFGRLVFASFGQFGPLDDVNAIYDPLGLLAAGVPPHTLWPQQDASLGEVELTALPRLDDAAPKRGLGGDVSEATATRVLSPSLRRVDAAYVPLECKESDDCDSGVCVKEEGAATGFCDAVGAALRPKVNDEDGLRRRETEDEEGNTLVSGLYEDLVVRAVVRDYVAWQDGTWALRWEGDIPNTQSPNGQLVCDKPGWQGGTCLSTEAGDTRIIDQTAQFCDSGVLAGDKVRLFGCADDGDCGLGQYCLVDPEAASGATGLCVSREAYEAGKEDLLQICRPFIQDACGDVRREFLVTRAYQDELWLQALDRRPESYVMMKTGDEQVDADAAALCRGERVPGWGPEGCVNAATEPACGQAGEPPCCPECVTPAEDPMCDGPDRPRCCASDYDFTSEVGFIECEERLLCAPEQPDNGCASHADCAAINPAYPLCLDGLCKRVCGPDEDCVQVPLPGPTCFQELAEYSVRARNSFIVEGPGSYGFLPQKVKADPETGECYEDTTVSNLLTSRIRVGVDEEDTRYGDRWPLPSCPAGTDKPDGGAPNPCMIDVVRPAVLPEQKPEAFFHVLTYGAEEPQPVPAIRYSNPMMSFVLDLTSLLDLAAPIPGSEDAHWPEGWSAFRRSRIAPGWSETFATRRGYTPFDVGVVTSSVALVGPTRIINAPELSTVFIVDSSGGGGGRGTRGQVVRVALAGGQSNPDVRFLVR